MARYIGPVCRVCRRLEMKMFLKGRRCHTVKCPIDKRGTLPGMHGAKPAKLSPYGAKLREIQRLKTWYNVRLRQLKNYFFKAQKMKGDASRNLLILLERRLSNVIRRVGFALSPAHARQLIVHGHFKVNNIRVTSPSYLVKEKDEITPATPASAEIVKSVRQVVTTEIPSWIKLTDDPPCCYIQNLPSPDEVPIPFNMLLIVGALTV